MSDGGISFIEAFGFQGTELTKTIVVQKGWYERLVEARKELASEISQAISNPHWSGSEPKPETRPCIPHDQWDEKLKAIAKGKPVFEKWYWHREKAINAIYAWNNEVDHIWNNYIEKRDKDGPTEKLSPRRWKEVRHQFVKYPISAREFTTEIWYDEIQKFQDFILSGKLPSGVIMAKNLPRLKPKQFANLLWFLQEVMGWVDIDEIDVCSDCGCLIMTDRETHDWCPECGKMRCESCTTAPYDCQCEYPCERHCKCKRDED